MVHDLQQLQQQIEELSKEPEQQGQQYTSTAAASTSAGAYSSGMLANTGLSTDAMARGQQQDVIADQAATICDLKRVIAGEILPCRGDMSASQHAPAAGSHMQL